MIAGIESLVIFLVFIALSGLSTWLQKKRQTQEETEAWRDKPSPPVGPRPGSPPETPQPRRPAPALDWEAELRRLLGGQPAAPPPVSHPAPPPLRPAPRPATPRPMPASRSEEEGGGGPRLVRLEDSTAAYRHAQQLHAQAAQQLRQAQEQTQRKGLAGRRPTVHSHSDDITNARALVANPRAARQAIIASVILGTPRGLE